MSKFVRILAGTSLALALLSGTALAATTATDIREGREYSTLTQTQPTDAKGKIEVTEFFWYGCSHCFAFEPKFAAWVKDKNTHAKDVVIKRVPVNFQANFVPHQRLFYTLEAMNRLDLHNKVFDTIHLDKQKLDNPAEIFAWAEKNGLDRSKFETTYNSFGIGTKAQQAKKLQDAYQVSGVPALAVDGKFYTDGALTRSMDRALLVVDDLIAQARKGP